MQQILFALIRYSRLKCNDELHVDIDLLLVSDNLNILIVDTCSSKTILIFICFFNICYKLLLMYVKCLMEISKIVNRRSFINIIQDNRKYIFGLNSRKYEQKSTFNQISYKRKKNIFKIRRFVKSDKKKRRKKRRQKIEASKVIQKTSVILMNMRCPDE